MRTCAFLVLGLAGLALASGLGMVSSDQAGVRLELSSPNPDVTEVWHKGEIYSRVSIPGVENLAEFSLPRLPVYRVWLEAPIGASVEFDVTVNRMTCLPGNTVPYAVEPGIQSATKDRPRSEYTMGFDPAVYEQGQAYPRAWVRAVEAGMMRGRNLILVEVMSVRWNPSDGSMQILNSASIDVRFVGGDLGETYYQAGRLMAAGFETMLSELLANYGTFEDPGWDTPPAPYLIVSHQDFASTMLDGFITWKESQGFDVTLVDLTETGSSATQIRDYIIDAIANWPDPPVYVLLVGDTGYLPGYSPTTYSGVTDLYYVCLDDGGYQPDAFLGRFSVQIGSQLELMCDRVIWYEQVSASAPWIQGSGWIASEDNWQISEGTHNYCISNFGDPLGYDADKLYRHTYGADASDVVASVNAGLSMLTFSGHGSETSWGDMPFSSGNFAQLNNDDMLPGVLSHACLTGSYNTDTGWCETWTRTPGKGAIWFWGSDPSTYWDEDDIQQKGEFAWFWGSLVYWPMGFLNGGKLAVYEYYGGGGSTKYYYEGYNLMGDPSLAMRIWGLTGIEDDEPWAPDGSPLAVAVLSANPVVSSAVLGLAGQGSVQLSVFDISGRLVETPFEGEISGTQTFAWDVSRLTPGVYFLRLTSETSMASARVTVLR
ncbi:T9SS type A sorting domain-containing protein [Candidatus Fermentibacterales bacterium]|nr:T9SS type A sorting domain-containing protein [Candidatus Fermentibacterales bacterium]